jgi:energy-coupling factor transporter transmembrane protein EcfT
MRSRIEAGVFAMLFCLAIYSTRDGGDQTYGLLAIIAAIVVLMVGVPLKQFPRWLKVSVWFLYVGIGAVLLFVLWVAFVGH